MFKMVLKPTVNPSPGRSTPPTYDTLGRMPTRFVAPVQLVSFSERNTSLQQQDAATDPGHEGDCLSGIRQVVEHAIAVDDVERGALQTLGMIEIEGAHI